MEMKKLNTADLIELSQKSVVITVFNAIFLQSSLLVLTLRGVENKKRDQMDL